MEYEFTKPSHNRLVSAERAQILLSDANPGSVIKVPELMKHLRSHFRLDWTGVHGSGHWARVLKFGLRIALAEGARTDVVTLFAFLHDHERFDDNLDPDHGPRAALNAVNLRDKYFTIDDEGFNLLCEAMCGHSNGETKADITVQACWDADRLDLTRFGITPDPMYLCTEYAKNIARGV
jgi:uncharacterized protein